MSRYNVRCCPKIFQFTENKYLKHTEKTVKCYSQLLSYLPRILKEPYRSMPINVKSFELSSSGPKCYHFRVPFQTLICKIADFN